MIKGIHHVGISVANLERSVRFYRDLMGMQVIVEKEFQGPQYEVILGLSGARGRLAVLRLKSLEIELFQFTHPIPARSDPLRPVCHHGITHFCIEVADVQADYDRLRAAGVIFHCPPLTFGAEKATYGRDPDGNVFEMLDLGESA
jgi:catechol 2,3-dioxygenase-like lactoylglutathione lyase family enzyme